MSQNSRLPEEFSALLGRLLDDELSVDDGRRLEELLSISDDARAEYHRVVKLHALLQWQIGSAEQSDLAPVSRHSSPKANWRENSLRVVSRPTFISAASGAAALAIVLGLLAVFYIPQRINPGHTNAAGEVVAQLTGAKGTVWSAGESHMPRGRLLRRGDELSLEAGLAEITFNDGAVATIKGPVRLRMESSNASRIFAGSVRINTDQSDVAFALHAPRALIIDEGTEFGVRVDEDHKTWVHVYDGVVLAQALSESGDVLASSTLLENAGAVVEANQIVRLEGIAHLFSGMRIEQETWNVAVANASFEQPQTKGQKAGLEGWVGPQPSGVFHNQAGNGNELPNLDGQQAAYLNIFPEKEIYQDLRERYLPGCSYQLTVALAARADRPPSPYATLELRLYYRNEMNTAVPIARTIVRNESLSDSELRDFSLALRTTRGEDPWAGRCIGISMQAIAPRGDWTLDNVRLVARRESEESESALAVSAESLVGVGKQKQLFVDDFVVDQRHGVTRELGHPQKQNGGEPVLVEDSPWEDLRAPMLGSVMHDGGKFRMWYRGAGSGAEQGVFCYAESEDGRRWKKPNLGLVEFEGSRQNNIYQIGQPQAYAPFLDPNEKDPQKRYKSAVGTTRIDTALAHSPDGLRWTFYHDGRALTGRASDTINQVIWDPFAKVYRLYTRTDFGRKREVSGTRDMVAAADADISDPKSWRTVRNWHIGSERGEEWGHRRQIYSLNGWPYEGVQFAIILTIEGRRQVDERATEEMDFYLATARGDQMWDLQWLYAGRPLVPRGDAGSFDSKWIQSAVNIVTFNDKHWLYYVGRSIAHAGEADPKREGVTAGIGLATLRLDGFISLTAGKERGSVVTKPFKLEGDALEVNIDAKNGDVKVELLDALGKPIAGYSGEEASLYKNVDELRLRPKWEKNLADLKGEVVRLKFTLRNAKLYAFQVQ